MLKKSLFFRINKKLHLKKKSYGKTAGTEPSLYLRLEEWSRVKVLTAFWNFPGLLLGCALESSAKLL